nr:LPS assembly lipoprotein LptE [Thaumasiovibrio subtropicus]
MTLFISACGFQLRDTSLLPPELDHVSLSSFDIYGPLSRIMRNQMSLYGIEHVPPTADTPNLHLSSEIIEERTLSLYQNSRRAEYELTMEVSYTISLPGKAPLFLTTQVNRNFLDNPQTALAKSVERELVENEMREQAVSQIMRQLARVNRLFETTENDADATDTQS